MRSMRQDRAVLQHRVKKGTARRMLTFAVPYREILAVFLPVVVIDAAVGAVNPLILRAIIDNGIAEARANVVIGLAVLVAALGPRRRRPRPHANAGSRPSSARASSTTCAPRCSATSSACRIAFFTRTQTGALVSRLNNDVIGAQQAFTDTALQRGGQLRHAWSIVLGRHVLPVSWKITLAACSSCPGLPHPGPLGRPAHRLAVTREGYTSTPR